MTNTNAGSNAATGFLLTNDVSHFLQFYMGSSTNSFLNDGAYIKTGGAGGFRFVTDGGSHPYVKWATLGLGGSSYMGWTDTSLYHTGIPPASNMTDKNVLVYDNISGRFNSISKDSIGSSVGSTTPTVVIECVIGNAYTITGGSATVTGLTAGSTVISSSEFGNVSLEITRGYIPIPGVDPLDGSTYFTKVLTATSFSLSNALVAGEYIKIKTISN